MKKKSKGVLFIDGDNISSDNVDYIVSKFEKRAETRVCTVYGNEHNSKYLKWCDIAPLYDMRTCPLTRKKEKNGADIKIAIDVVNLLNRNSNITTFGFASCDYDFSLIADEVVSRGYDVRSGSKKLDHSLRWTYESQRRLFDVQEEKKIYC